MKSDFGQVGVEDRLELSDFPKSSLSDFIAMQDFGFTIISFFYRLQSHYTQSKKKPFFAFLNTFRSVVINIMMMSCWESGLALLLLGFQKYLSYMVEAAAFYHNFVHWKKKENVLTANIKLTMSSMNLAHRMPDFSSESLLEAILVLLVVETFSIAAVKWKLLRKILWKNQIAVRERNFKFSYFNYLGFSCFVFCFILLLKINFLIAELQTH